MTSDNKIPDLIGVGAQAIADTAKRLGLTWNLRPATVTSLEPLTVTDDADTGQIKLGAVSLIGELQVGQRVMTMFVPPGGLFVIGTIGTTVTQRILKGAQGSSTTGLTTSGTTELALSFLDMTGISLRANFVYDLFASFVSLSQTVSTDIYQFRFRVDASISGTLIGLYNYCGALTGSLSSNISATYIPAADVVTSIFVSVVRASGTGTLTIAPRVAGGSGQLASFARVTEEAILNQNWFLQ